MIKYADVIFEQTFKALSSCGSNYDSYSESFCKIMFNFLISINILS